MSPAVDLLSQYAAYHRDQRNIATHFVGVPLIVFGVGVLLSKPALALDGLPQAFQLTPGWLAVVLASIWYLTRGGLALGAAVSAWVGALVLLGHQVSVTTGHWLAWGAGAFLLGWMLQFVGHWYEGKKPAFVDDVSGLLVGPMFITAEAMFARGWNAPMHQEIERRAGPTFVRDMAT